MLRYSPAGDYSFRVDHPLMCGTIAWVFLCNCLGVLGADQRRNDFFRRCCALAARAEHRCKHAATQGQAMPNRAKLGNSRWPGVSIKENKGCGKTLKRVEVSPKHSDQKQMLGVN